MPTDILDITEETMPTDIDDCSASNILEKKSPGGVTNISMPITW